MPIHWSHRVLLECPKWRNSEEMCTLFYILNTNHARCSETSSWLLNYGTDRIGWWRKCKVLVDGIYYLLCKHCLLVWRLHGRQSMESPFCERKIPHLFIYELIVNKCTLASLTSKTVDGTHQPYADRHLWYRMTCSACLTCVTVAWSSRTVTVSRCEVTVRSLPAVAGNLPCWERDRDGDRAVHAYKYI